MPNDAVTQPFPLFTDVDGTPLEDGFIYIGEEGLNPLASPIPVFSDSALTTPLLQPVRTLGGYPVSSGTPIGIYTGSANYSILIQNKNEVLVMSTLSFSGVADEAIVDIIDFGVAGDGVTDDTVPAQAFLDFLATNGGKGIVSVPIRVSTLEVSNNATPFVLEWLGQNTVLSANIIDTPLTFTECSGVTFIRYTCDGRATEQGAINEADGIYHGMVWDDCVDMYAYQPNVKNYNGIGIYALGSSFTATRNFIEKGQADCAQIGEKRTGFQLENAVDSSIVECFSFGMSYAGSVLSGNVVGCSIINGLVSESAMATRCDTEGGESITDSIIEGVIVKNCVGGATLSRTTNVKVSLPLVDLTNAPSFPLGSSTGITTDNNLRDDLHIGQFIGDLPTLVNFGDNASNTNFTVDNAVLNSGVFFIFNATSSGCTADVKRAFENTIPGDEYTEISTKFVNAGTNNTVRYFGGPVREGPQSFVRRTNYPVIISGALTLEFNLFQMQPNEFITLGDVFEVFVAGFAVGTGSRTITGEILLNGLPLATIDSTFNAGSTHFAMKFICTARNTNSQRSFSTLVIADETSEYNQDTTTLVTGGNMFINLRLTVDSGTVNFNYAIVEVIRQQDGF